jgi:hypothetical protein
VKQDKSQTACILPTCATRWRSYTHPAFSVRKVCGWLRWLGLMVAHDSELLIVLPVVEASQQMSVLVELFS